MHSALGNDDQSRSSRAHVVVLSRRLLARRVWHASQYEFEDVILDVEDARLVAQALRDRGAAGPLSHGIANRFRKAAHLPRRSMARPLKDDISSDLLFAVFAAPHEIGILPLAPHVVANAKKKVAFIVEMYEPEVVAAKDYLLQLRGFDHIFVFTRAVIPAIQSLTGVPTSFLPTGVDALLFASASRDRREATVLSYGRRIPRTHESLYQAATCNEIVYDFDTVHGPFDVTDHREHRFALSRRLHRSRYTVIQRNNDDPRRALRTAGEETLSNRLFEAAAAGTVILGTAPQTPDFDHCFPWLDAIVPLPTDPSDIPHLVRMLDADPERVAAASTAGAIAGLRSLDWAYRWAEILDAVDLRPSPKLATRLAALGVAADRLEQQREW